MWKPITAERRQCEEKSTPVAELLHFCEFWHQIVQGASRQRLKKIPAFGNSGAKVIGLRVEIQVREVGLKAVQLVQSLAEDGGGRPSLSSPFRIIAVLVAAVAGRIRIWLSPNDPRSILDFTTAAKEKTFQDFFGAKLFQSANDTI